MATDEEYINCSRCFYAKVRYLEVQGEYAEAQKLRAAVEWQETNMREEMEELLRQQAVLKIQQMQLRDVYARQHFVIGRPEPPQMRSASETNADECLTAAFEQLTVSPVPMHSDEDGINDVVQVATLTTSQETIVQADLEDMQKLLDEGDEVVAKVINAIVYNTEHQDEAAKCIFEHYNGQQVLNEHAIAVIIDRVKKRFPHGA
jgi:spore germination protein GerM